MIPYGPPLIYSTIACDAAPSVRLFLLPLSPPPRGHFKEKRHIMTTKTLSKSELAQFTAENWIAFLAEEGRRWRAVWRRRRLSQGRAPTPPCPRASASLPGGRRFSS